MMEEEMGFSLCVSLNDEVSQFVRQSGEDSGVILRKAVLHPTQVPSVACGMCLMVLLRRPFRVHSDPRKAHVSKPMSSLS